MLFPLPGILFLHVFSKNQEFQKNIYFSFIDYAKAFDCVDHNNLRKILQTCEYQAIWLDS